MGHTLTPATDSRALNRWVATIHETCSTAGDIRAYFMGAATVILDGAGTDVGKLTQVRCLLRAANIVAADLGVKL